MANMHMRCILSAVIIMGLVPARHAAVNSEQESSSSDEKGGKQKNTPYTFPDVLPKSRIHVDEDVLKRVNELADPVAQIEYLISRLPQPKKSERKVLSYSQVSAIRLLGLTRSEKAVKPLIGIIDYEDTRDGHQPAPLALEDLGEEAVNGLVNLLKTSKEHQRVTPAARALAGIKGKSFSEFVESQRGNIPEENYRVLKLFVDARKFQLGNNN